MFSRLRWTGAKSVVQPFQEGNTEPLRELPIPFGDEEEGLLLDTANK